MGVAPVAGRGGRLPPHPRGYLRQNEGADVSRAKVSPSGGGAPLEARGDAR